MLCDKLENVLKVRGKMPPTVSVIIPVYNIENYPANSLESVLNQSYQQLEIICVNDGSKDGSAQVMNSFAEKTCKQIGKKHLKAFMQEKNISLKVRLMHFLRFMFRFLK